MNKVILGLDIGIGSVGWALIEEGKRIIDLGVRTFDVSEDPVTKTPANRLRHIARRQRLKYHHRKSRLKSLLSYLVESKLIDDQDIILKNPQHKDIWQLRAKALKDKLSSDEIALIIYHICKHRGFYWVSSCERNDEEGKIKSSLATNAQLMKDKGYLTVGQMIYSEHPNSYRNKDGDYSKCISRIELDLELRTIFAKQQELCNTIISSDLITAIVGIGDRKSGYLWQQKPAIQGDQILNQVGRCRFESQETRAPKANYLAIRHAWITKLVRLKVVDNKFFKRFLHKDEFKVLKEYLFTLSKIPTFKSLENALIKSKIWKKGQFKIQSSEFDSNIRNSIEFDGLHYWIQLKNTFTSSGLESSWNRLIDEIKAGAFSRFNYIALVLTAYKEDDEIASHLKKIDLTDDEIAALLKIRFTKFYSFSEKALSNFVPYMEVGFSYEEACTKAGYDVYLKCQTKYEKTKYLPSLYYKDKKGNLILNNQHADLPCNHVILKALNQTIKVVNAVIKKYGTPSTVHIELARELSKSIVNRQEIQKAIYANTKRNTILKNDFIKHFGEDRLNDINLEKYKLYNDQEGISLYSGSTINLEKLLDDAYVQIDHILPFSKSFDNSKHNRVLVLTNENKAKGNKAPLEYVLLSKFNVEAYKNRILNLRFLSNGKKERLLTESFSRASFLGFKNANLVDTSYLCSYAKFYIESHLKTLDKGAGCVSIAANLTSFLRNKWELIKNRDTNDRHHAIDAVTIASCSEDLINLLKTLYSQNLMCSLDELNENYLSSTCKQINELMHLPWDSFSKEVNLRVNEDEQDKLKCELTKLGNYSKEQIESCRPLIISRAVRRIKKGVIHGDTVYKIKNKEKDEVVVRIPLQNLNLKKLELMVDKDRNINLYNLLKERLIAFNDNGEKAFLEPIYMPCKNSSQGPIIKKVSIIQVKTGIPVRGGIAINGELHRVDFFKKNEKYYAIPVYSWQQELPNKIAVKGKRECDWLTLDASYKFCFSVYKNDFLEISTKGKIIRGYYAEFDRHRCSILIKSHDRNELLEQRVAYMQVDYIKKLNVDLLGNVYDSFKEENTRERI
jgi:CRISPR-associated endonuclease Csn1